jgi:ATP-dependent RNA helicase SUPV3L1/SUV3
MLDYNTKYKCIVIDEAFMVYDADRGKSWTKAILEANADEVHIILSEEALNIIVKILDSTNRVYEINKYDMLQKFKFAESPTTFGKNLPKGTVFVVFSRRSVILNKTMLENLGYSVSMLYGNLPPEVKKNQINRFINKETDLMVTTDVIGMGINLPVHALVFLETTKFDGISERKLNTIEVKQIAGRTGRYGISNENSFVSAKTNGDLRYITETYNNSYQINNAYIGFDYKMFMSFDENMSIINRIDNFKNIDFIPNDLRDFIYKESTTKYSNIAELVDKNNFTLDEKYIFLNAPVKENNKVYFEECVKDYNKHNIIKPPLVKITNDTKSMEDNISKMELYLNLCRNLNHDVEVFENFKTTKYEFIEILDKMLLDKTLMSTKTCKLCDTKLSITHPYSYCENCYQTKIRSEYNNDYDVYDRYEEAKIY